MFGLKRLFRAIRTLTEMIEALAVTIGVLNVELRLRTRLPIPNSLDDGWMDLGEYARARYAGEDPAREEVVSEEDEIEVNGNGTTNPRG